MDYIAVVRIKGNVRIPLIIQDTLSRLNLTKKNNLVFLEKTDSILGMVEKVKDYVTYGDVEESFVKEIFSKKGKNFLGETTDSKQKYVYKGRFIEIDGVKYSKTIKLKTPKGGYAKNGTKKHIKLGGALGYRGQDIVDFINKML
ncbi:MAG: uL30 family ribosomal protein [Candidatus Nanoarchaeia archaeon]|nr:uL30 family ribosomal protein [Candidatus Nanoarchaeia archaeon]